MNKFEFAIPQKLDDAFSFLKTKNAFVKAGGIDLLDLMKEGITTPQRLVNIRDLEELKFIKPDNAGALRMGPTVTLAELASHPVIQEKYRALAQAAGEAATPQVRNSATLAGNLCQRPHCWYFRSADFDCLRKGGDTCFAVDGENQYHAIFGNEDGCVIVHPSAVAVALSALQASLKITNGKHTREISMDEFFVRPAQDITKENNLQADEIITEIILPPITGGVKSFYFKQKEKQAFDWPIADVAAVLTVKQGTCRDARIVLGAAAPVPWRIQKAEEVLKNKTITVKLAKEAARAALNDATPLSGNAYKVTVFKTMIYRTICWAAEIDPFA